MKNQKRKCFKKNIGTMACLDVYLLIVPEEKLQALKDKIEPKHKIRYPLLCWDIIAMQAFYHTSNTFKQTKNI